MKTLLAASFAALMLAGAAAADAATPGPLATAGATTTGTVSTPYADNTGASEALPVFDYQGAVPVTSTIVSRRTNSIASAAANSVRPAHVNSLAPWNVDLVHATGDGSR